MVKELTQAVTLLFRRTGMSPQPRKQLVMIASMELHWFSPSDAQRMLDKCIELKLLKETEGGLYIPTFDIKERDVPIDFALGIEALEERGDDLFLRIVETISLHTKKEHSKIITAMVAGLFVGKKYGAPLETMYDEVDKELIKRAKEM